MRLECPVISYFGFRLRYRLVFACSLGLAASANIQRLMFKNIVKLFDIFLNQIDLVVQHFGCFLRILFAATVIECLNTKANDIFDCFSMLIFG